MRSDSKATVPALMTGAVFVALTAGITLFQTIRSRTNLPSDTLKRGRVVLGSGMPAVRSWPGLKGDGSPSHLLDDDVDAPAILARPSPHPEGMHWLVDLALTHWPPVAGETSPRRRRPRELVIYNGLCTTCPVEIFRRYPRIKTARLEILERRANDPDVEYVIPETHPVWVQEINLPDAQGPVRIALPLPAAERSAKYPDHVFYIIAKIIPHELYPGTQVNAIVPLAEVQYGDSDADEGALQKETPVHYWK